jgi:hypothetical protein
MVQQYLADGGRFRTQSLPAKLHDVSVRPPAAAPEPRRGP